jgi:hypothetical protein
MTRKGKGLRFGTLNVGSLHKMGRKEEIIEMMIRRKIDILGLSETKWSSTTMEANLTVPSIGLGQQEVGTAGNRQTLSTPFWTFSQISGS